MPHAIAMEVIYLSHIVAPSRELDVAATRPRSRD
jgi:hypothetical protein